MFHISLDKIYYVHARARYIYLATILRFSHVCGVQWSRVWRNSRFLELSIGGRQHAVPRRVSPPPALLEHYQQKLPALTSYHDKAATK